MHMRKSGFTIVELLIVIVVIAILAMLVLNSFTIAQQKARDTDRQNDVSTIDKHLETYYAHYGHYPSYKQLSTWSWVKDHLKGVPVAAFYPPLHKFDVNRPNIDTSLFKNGTSATKDNYGYQATCTDQGTITDDKADCSAFTLTWTSEASNHLRTVNGLSNNL